MALLKLICNTGAKLFVDQEFVSELQENKLCITELSAGMYLVDVVSLIDDQIKVSFELSFGNDNQQILKRIDLAEEDKEYKQNELKSELMRNPNLSFYRNLARFEYNGLWGYVDNNYEIVVEPIYSSAENFFNEFALVSKSFSEEIKYALIDTKGENRMGVWFDEVFLRNEDRLFVRRNDELLSYDVKKDLLFSYVLNGEIKDDDLIPVTWENNFCKKGGYINRQGEVVLPFIYDQVSNFNEDGFAEVERFGYKRFITKKGDICIYNTIYEIKYNHPIDASYEYFLLDKQFDWCGPLEKSHRDSIFLCDTLRMAVKKGGKWGYCYFLPGNGVNCLKTMIPCKYDAPLSNSEFNFVIMRDRNECCVVNILDVKYKGGSSVYGEVGTELFRIEADNISPIIIKEAHWISGDYWKGIDDRVLSLFHFNKVVVVKNGKYGVVDKNTKQYVLPCEYDDIYFLEKKYYLGHEDGLKKSHNYYSKDFFIVEKGGLKEIINKDAELFTNIQAIDIFLVGTLLAIKTVDQDNYYRLFSIEKGIINILFDEIKPSECGLIFKKDNKYGFASNKGELYIDSIYDKIENSYGDNDSIKVYLDDKCGCYIGKTKILDCIYDSIKKSSYYAHIYIVEKNGKEALWYDTTLTDFYEEVDCDSQTVYSKLSIGTVDGFIDQWMEHFDYAYLVTINKSKYGLLNQYGKMLLDFVYDAISINEYLTDDDKMCVKARKGSEYYDYEL